MNLRKKIQLLERAVIRLADGIEPVGNNRTAAEWDQALHALVQVETAARNVRTHISARLRVAKPRAVAAKASGLDWEVV